MRKSLYGARLVKRVTEEFRRVSLVLMRLIVYFSKVNKKCIRLNPDVDLYFSQNGCAKLGVLLFTGLLPFWPLKESYIEVILPNYFLK